MSPVKFLVIIPYNALAAFNTSDANILSKLNFKEVVVVSKWKHDEEISISDLKLIDRRPLVKCLTGNYKGHLYLVERDWLQPLPPSTSLPPADDTTDIGSNAPRRPREIYSPAGGAVTLVGGQGGSTQGRGGAVSISAGQGGSTQGRGGAVSISAGQGSYSFDGGSVADGDLLAVDGTRQLLFDASAGELEMTGVNFRKTQSNQLDKPKKILWKREKLLLKQHKHANECALEESLHRSQERVDIATSRHQLYATCVRWCVSGITLLGLFYMVT